MKHRIDTRLDRVESTIRAIFPDQDRRREILRQRRKNIKQALWAFFDIEITDEEALELLDDARGMR